MTILLVDLPVGPGDSPDHGGWDQLDETVADAGGAIFERTVDLAHAGTIALAAFHIAADAAAAGVRLADALPVAGGHPARAPAVAHRPVHR